MTLKDNPLVSVIMPVYNGSKFIRLSIESVLAQSYDNFELLIIDDGSKDDTQIIVSGCRDRRVRIFKNDINQGLFKTLNASIRRAQGDFIRLWSYDDIMKPFCLQQEMFFYRDHPAIGMSYCARDIIDDSGKVVAIAPVDRTPDIIAPELAVQMLFYFGSIAGNISTVMIKKDIFDKVGFFSEDMIQSADFQMWARISAVYPIGFIRQPLIYLRKHMNQFSQWKGMGLVFIREDAIVMKDLAKRLPVEIADFAPIYERWHRRIQYFNYMVRCFILGDLQSALGVYREIRLVDNVLVLFLIWLVSAGGRWFKKKPKFVYQ